MDNATKSHLIKTLQKEFVRRNLIMYFENKGYNNFLVKPYPPTVVDIADKIEILQGIVEVKYYLEDINMENNVIKVGWNIFALGNQRAFLGNTTHNSVTDIETSMSDSKSYPDGNLTIKEIVEWMVETIGSSKKLKDIYQQHNYNGNNNAIGSSYMKPYKSIPNFKRRV